MMAWLYSKAKQNQPQKVTFSPLGENIPPGPGKGALERELGPVLALATNTVCDIGQFS